MKKLQLLFVSTFIAWAQPLLGQAGGDPTTPPAGSPGRVMKSLDQVEARIPLIDGEPGVGAVVDGFMITEPGSYYLVENLSIADGYGVRILAHDVRLDLNGFNISFSGLSEDADAAVICIGKNIRVENGSISGPFTYGIVYGTDSENNINISLANLDIIGCVQGLVRSPIGTAIIDSIENCRGSSSADGFYATVIKDTVATKIEDGHAIRGNVVTNVRGESLQGIGVYGTIVTNSFGTSEGSDAGDHGIVGATVSHSRGVAEAGNGIYVERGMVNHSTARSTDEAGIYVERGSVSYSTGQSSQSIGILNAAGVISYSYGDRSGGDGIAISGEIIIGSTVADGDTVFSSPTAGLFGGSKHLGTP